MLADPTSLAEILCIEEEGVVARDNTITYAGRHLQLPAKPAARSLRRVTNKAARVPRSQPCGVPRTAAHDPVPRRGQRDRGRPDRNQRDAVLAGVKAWPGDGRCSVRARRDGKP